MDYFLREEQRMIKETTRELADEKIIPQRAELDEKNEFAAELLRDMDRRGRKGELTGRVRALYEAPGAQYADTRVTVLGPNAWTVTIEAVIDRVVIGKVKRSRLVDSIETALSLSGGTLLAETAEGEQILLGEDRALVAHTIDGLGDRHVDVFFLGEAVDGRGGLVALGDGLLGFHDFVGRLSGGERLAEPFDMGEVYGCHYL